LSRWGLGILFALLICLSYSGEAFGKRNFGGRDLLAYNLPMEKVTHDAYARGVLPIWNSYISGGRPHLPNPNVGALYPVRPALAWLGFPAAMRLFPLLHWIAAGIGISLLLRSIGSSTAAAWVGAVTYVFSGVGVSYVFYPHIHPGMALFPWILWIVARRGMSVVSRTLALSVLWIFDLLAADLFTVGLALASALLWIVLEEEARERWVAFRVVAGSLALGCVAAAPQIVATSLWVGETQRSVLGITLRSALLFSIPWPRLLEFIVPFPFGANWSVEDARVWGWPVFHYKMMGLFTSLYSGALAVIAAFSWRRISGRGSRFSGALLLVGLLVTVLPSLTPSTWLEAHSPIPLRNPEKLALAINLSLALLSGLFVDHFRRSPAVPRWTLVVAGTLALAAAFANSFREPVGRAAALLAGDIRFWRIASREIPGALAEAGLLWILTVIALDFLGSRLGAGRAVCWILLTFVPIAADRKIAQTFREEEIFAPTRFARQLARWDPAGEYRTLPNSEVSRLAFAFAASDRGLIEGDRRDGNYQTLALWNRGAVISDDFDVADFLRLESLRRWIIHAAPGAEARATLFGSLSLRWGIRYQDQPPRDGFEPIQRYGLQVWDENRRALPDIRIAETCREKAGPIAAFGALATLDPGEVVVESGSDRRQTSSGAKVRVTRDSPERLELDIEAPQDAWLFVLRGFWRYREVLLDERPVEAVPAQLAFSGLEIPAGRHRVIWKETVPGLEFSRWGPILYLLAAAWLLVRQREARRNRLAARGNARAAESET
jgi:hypothetical protein